MLELRSSVLVIVAIATFVVPAGFLAVVLAAVARRRGGHPLGPRWTGAVALLGGAALGTMFLIAAEDLLLALPLVVAAVAIAIGQWRAGHPALAGLVVAGATLPWTVLWAGYVVMLVSGEAFDASETFIGFGAGAIPTALALAIAARYPEHRPARASAPGATPAPRRVFRSFNTVGMAMREPSRIGPFGMPELAALVVLVASLLGVAALSMLGLPVIVAYALSAIVGSALATEAWLRAMAPRTRRSMEAFIWLGSPDLAAIRASTGAGVPTTRAGAAQWLARHPPTEGEPQLMQAVRVELSLLAGRTADAEAAVARLPDSTPEERFYRASMRDLVAWWTARGDDLAGMAEALAAIVPPDGEEHLRAEVTLAVAQVRHRAVAQEPVEDLLEPLLGARDRLGARAEGIVRRVFWPRLFRVFLVAEVVIAILGVATSLPAPIP